MAHSVYVASAEGHTAKSVVALGIVEALAAKFDRVNVFRAISAGTSDQDPVLELLHGAAKPSVPLSQCRGISYRQVHESADTAMSEVLERYKNVESQSDAVVVLGSDYTDVLGTSEFEFNARIATTLGIPMVLVFNGRQAFTTTETMGQAAARSAQDIEAMTSLVLQEAKQAHTSILALVINRADPDNLATIRDSVKSGLAQDIPVWAIPEDPHLLAPRMSQILEAVDGRLAYGHPAALNVEAMDLTVAAMTPEHVLQRIADDSVVIVPSDRTDVLLALLMADASSTFPRLAGIVINGGFEISQTVQQLIEGLHPRVPVIETTGTSFGVTLKVSATRGVVSAKDPDKVARASRLARENIEFDQLIARITEFSNTVITPILFEYQLVQRAKSDKKTIVLPEGTDDRILQAASEVLQREIANLIILGIPAEISARAKTLGLDLSRAELMPIEHSEHFELAVAEYQKLRKHKGISEQQAREKMSDVSYFGTMLVQLGIADGMVSGATHTTAQTITPAFEVIRTKPGVSVASSVFLMALEDRVLVYGDCAVIPEPTSEQMADIAISSAQTALNFGITPRVAMLSYSTGTSGSGADVDKVRAATELVRARAPQLSVDGPIQYDAAVDVAVAKAKMPQSNVAGHATVFIFPDLNTGNNTYKAVQRTSGAVAIGPILQGLNKPVNDLSRGALVNDIVNTIAITAIQAQQV